MKNPNKYKVAMSSGSRGISFHRKLRIAREAVADAIDRTGHHYSVYVWNDIIKKYERVL